MDHANALALIRDAPIAPGGTWADLGAGSGVFTRALAERLGPQGTVHALDRQPQPLTGGSGLARILTARGDFTEPLPYRDLDGILMANALHFARRQDAVLREVVRALRPGGSLLLIEYDQRAGNPWVPFPVPPGRFAALAEAVGLSHPRELGRRASRYGPRDLYAALAVNSVAPSKPSG